MVGFAATKHSPLVTHLGIGIDSEKVEIGLSAQSLHLTGGSHTLDNAVLTRSLGLLIQLLHNP